MLVHVADRPFDVRLQPAPLIYGCANRAGEDNRNVARMSALLAGLLLPVPGSTVNRLCGSGLDALGSAARAIRSGEAELTIAGGVESMSRAPFVIGKAESAFSRSARIEDTTIGWRFVNRLMKERHGVDSMPETAENVADEFGIIDRRYAPSAMQAGPGGAIILWHVDDLEATFARLIEMGAVEYDPITKRGETGFATASVVDPFGNVLGIMHNPHFAEMH